MVQLQDALWRDLPALKDPVLHTLDRINVDRHLLDQEVRQQMRVGAARLLAGRWVVAAVLIFEGRRSFLNTKRCEAAQEPKCYLCIRCRSST